MTCWKTHCLNYKNLVEFHEIKKKCAYGLKTISNTTTCRKQISESLGSLQIDLLDQFWKFTKTDQAILQEINREIKCYMEALMNTEYFECCSRWRVLMFKKFSPQLPQQNRSSSAQQFDFESQHTKREGEGVWGLVFIFWSRPQTQNRFGVSVWGLIFSFSKREGETRAYPYHPIHSNCSSKL